MSWLPMKYLVRDYVYLKFTQTRLQWQYTYFTYENIQQLPSKYTCWLTILSVSQYIVLLIDLHYQKICCGLTEFQLMLKKKVYMVNPCKDTINPVCWSWKTFCCPESQFTLRLLITPTLAEGSVLVLVLLLLLLAGWFPLLLSSQSFCWWSGGLAAPCSQSEQDSRLIFFKLIDHFLSYCTFRLRSHCRQIWFKSDSFSNLIFRPDCPHCY